MRARVGADGSPRLRWATPTRRRGSPDTVTGWNRSRRNAGMAVAGRIGGPVALEGQRGDEAQPVDLGGGQQGDAERAGDGVELVAERRARKGQQQLEVGQVFERQAVGSSDGHGMAFGDHQHQVLLEQQPGDQVPAAHRQVEDGQIELAVGQLRLEARGVSLHDDQAELRMTLGHRVHQPGHQPPGRGADHADPDRPGHLVLAGGHIGQQGVELGQDPAGPGHDDGALLGEPAVGPVDEGGAQLLLQPGHVGRDVGLHGPEVLGSGREGPVVADRGQRLEVPEFHRF